jgi:nucleoid-associated protein YgaU
MRPEIKVGMFVGVVVIAVLGWLVASNSGSGKMKEIPFTQTVGDTRNAGNARRSGDNTPINSPRTQPEGAGGQPVRRDPPVATPTRAPAGTTGEQAPITIKPPERVAAPQPQPTSAPPNPSGGANPASPGGTTTTPWRTDGTPTRVADSETISEPPPERRDSQTPATQGGTSDVRRAADIIRPPSNDPANNPALRPPPEDVAKPPERPAATPPGTSGKTYKVQPSDTLIGIAREVYGDESMWTRIKAANPGVDESRLLVGQVLKLPDAASATAPPTRAATSDTAEGTTVKPNASPAASEREPRAAAARYIVAEGDSLRQIARDVLGNEDRWKEIFDLNKDKVRSPDLLYVGLALKMPEKYGSTSSGADGKAASKPKSQPNRPAPRRP